MDNRKKAINENNIENINYEEGKPNRFNTATKIISITLSIIAIIISVFTLDTNKKAYNLDSEENLSMSVTTDIVNFILDDTILIYKTKMSVCFINHSNIPIYITNLYVNKIRNEKDGFKTITVATPVYMDEISYPINIKPQETIFADYYVYFLVPVGINMCITENFNDIINTNPVDICNFLFFDKHFDLLGNVIETKIIDDTTYYNYNYTPAIMMEITCETAKGHKFSTRFKDGLYIDTKTTNYKFEFFEEENSVSEYIYEYLSQENLVIIIAIQFTIIILLFFVSLVFKNRTRKCWGCKRR